MAADVDVDPEPVVVKVTVEEPVTERDGDNDSVFDSDGVSEPVADEDGVSVEDSEGLSVGEELGELRVHTVAPLRLKYPSGQAFAVPSVEPSGQ